jgi:hypothetical protein
LPPLVEYFGIQVRQKLGVTFEQLKVTPDFFILYLEISSDFPQFNQQQNANIIIIVRSFGENTQSWRKHSKLARSEMKPKFLSRIRRTLFFSKYFLIQKYFA